MTASIWFPFPITGQFLSPRRFMLESPFLYRDSEKGWSVTVEAGFTTDFNSSPRGLWNLFAPWDYLEAGLIHDWLYRYPAAITLHKPGILSLPLSRSACDAIHYRILTILGCPRWKRWGAWLLIRAGGWSPWQNYRRSSTPSSYDHPKEMDL